MHSRVNAFAIGFIAVSFGVLLSACGLSLFLSANPTTAAPGYSYGPGGMMGGGGMMGRGGMMGGGYASSAPTAVPTPVGATPIPVDEEIQITAANVRFAPAEVIVKPGEIVRFVVTNDDAFLHNFVSQPAGIPLLNLPGNTTQTITWTAPEQTGTYTAVCTLHPGMSLSVVVEG